MDIIQRMIAENQQTVTSQELAEAAGMTHEELCQFIEKYRNEFDRTPVSLPKTINVFNLDADQVFAVVIFMEMSYAFYEGKATPADKLKMRLKASAVKLFMARKQAAQEMRETAIELAMETYSITYDQVCQELDKLEKELLGE